MKKTHKYTPKICLLIPYFGKWPEYFELFLFTVKKQKELQVMLFTDLNYDGNLPENVMIVPMTLSEFNQLASKRLNLDIKLENPYKLCDFKPAYGFIFQDYIKDYSYWAFGDLDLIYGDLSKHLPANWQGYDFLSFHDAYVSGSFAIFKNINEVNNLFKKSTYYEKYFCSSENFAFDECFDLYHVLLKEGLDSILKYDKGESFTWVVYQETKKQKIKSYFEKKMTEFIHPNDYIKYEDGNIIRYHDNKNYMYYHYVIQKKSHSFYYPSWEIIPEKFFINRTGFFTEKEFTTWRKKPIIFFRKIHGLYKRILNLPKSIKNRLGNK